ncbi:MAG: phosphoribosyltransferase family protein [archaeon]|jgi:hypothetical protein
MYSMSWNEFESLSFELAKKIKSSKKEVDLIICVSRGGLVLGKILSEILEKPLAVISAKYINDKYTIDENISSLYPIKGDILLVDDIMEETTNEIVKVIKRNKQVKTVTLATLFYRPKGKKLIPDFSINEIQRTMWITFPYQKDCLKENCF